MSHNRTFRKSSPAGCLNTSMCLKQLPTSVWARACRATFATEPIVLYERKEEGFGKFDFMAREYKQRWLIDGNQLATFCLFLFFSR